MHALKLANAMLFLSTLSLRRATSWVYISLKRLYISIHALLAESDPGKVKVVEPGFVFLSTLSLRRATRRDASESIGTLHFYPRSPCGERLVKFSVSGSAINISIHALLAESD